MLARRVYLGEVAHGSSVHPDAHEPLVDRLTWERAQAEAPRRRSAAAFPLSGIATCAQCGEALIGPFRAETRTVRVFGPIVAGLLAARMPPLWQAAPWPLLIAA